MSNKSLTVTIKNNTPGTPKQLFVDMLKYKQVLSIFRSQETDRCHVQIRAQAKQALSVARHAARYIGPTQYVVRTMRNNVQFSYASTSRSDAVTQVRQQIREHRKNERTPYKTERYHRVYRNDENISGYMPMIGGVHEKPGEFLKLYKGIRASVVFKSKKPLSSEKHIAFELEFFSRQTRNELASEFADANLSDYVTVKGDGSIRPPAGYEGYEIAVCIPRSELIEVTNRVCEVLKRIGADVNRTCGFHVHLDMRHVTEQYRDLIFSNLVSAQKMLYRMMPPSRKLGNNSNGRSGGYSKPNRSKSYHANLSDRYVGVNALAYNKFKTLEVRLHSGTTDYVKIISFILILEAIVAKADEVKRAATTVPGFIKQFGIPSELGFYIESRVAKFANSHDTNDTSAEDVTS